MPKSNLYTRTGDTGQTSLVDGSRVSKDSLRLDAYGTVDEFSSFLGVVLSNPGCPQEVKGQLLEIQNSLFDLGSYLASPSHEQPVADNVAADGTSLPHIDEDLTRLEGWIDALDEQTPKIQAFVLPGGSEISAHAHVARTVCRRAERRVISLASKYYVDPKVIKYLNRLSDYLFITARFLNFAADIPEITWQQRK